MSDFGTPRSPRDSIEAISPWATYKRPLDTRRILDSAAKLESKIDELTDGVISKDPIATRNLGHKSNYLGLIGIDASGINCVDTRSVIEAGQAVERHRGGEGFNPNTVTALWGEGDQLCISALANIVANYTAWNQ